MLTKGLYTEKLCINQEHRHANVRENYVLVYQVIAVSKLHISIADYWNIFTVLFLVMLLLSTSYFKAKITSMEVAELPEGKSRCQSEKNTPSVNQVKVSVFWFGGFCFGFFPPELA